MTKKSRFDQFGFQPFIGLAIDKLGFYEPTEVQQKLIPGILKVKVSLANLKQVQENPYFILPIINNVNPEKDAVQAVITAPSRELATQIYNEIRKVTKYSEKEIAVQLVIGGTDKQRAIDKLKKQPQIIVGTPGRINDLIREQALFVHTAKTLVIDEADMT